jgi:HK97 family phage major capsid protein
MFLPGWAEIQTQNNRIAPSLSPFTLTPDDHGVIYWTDQTTRTSNAAARSDGSAAAEQVYAWTGYSETVDNISAMVPVHKEALKHISILENEIKRLLTDDIAVALDDYAYTGSGTAPQIGGIYTRSTAFDAAAYIAAGGFTPENANMYDLLVSMAAQIMKTTKYNVDTAWINPYDALKMKLNKDDNGVYTMPPFVVPSAGGMITVSNMKIIEANSVTAGTCVVGDSSKARLYSTGMAEIEIGYNLTGDFSKRILTILGNLEASLLIRNAEVDAFLKSTDIDADVLAITSGA